MNELVPEVRKDKRGRMVTRWVKRDATGKPASRTAIPKLTSTEAEKLETRRNRTANRLAKLLLIHKYYDPDEAASFAKEMVEKYTRRSSFDVIDRVLRDNPQRITDVELIVLDYPEDKARTILFFMDHLHEDMSSDNERDALLDGLRDYETLSDVDDFATLKGPKLEEAVALVRAGSCILEYDPQYDMGIREQTGPANAFRWHITDEKLVDTILANLDRLDEITVFMEKRLVFDGEAVASYLNEHTALNEGFL